MVESEDSPCFSSSSRDPNLFYKEELYQPLPGCSSALGLAQEGEASVGDRPQILTLIAVKFGGGSEFFFLFFFSC